MMTRSLFILVLTGIATGAIAAEPPAPAHRPDIVVEQAFGSRLEAMERDSVAKSEAKYLRNLYKALIAEGFTNEEAFEIVVHHQSLLLSR